MTLPPPEATAEDRIAFVNRLEDGCIKDPNRAAWEINKQRWLDLYTGNHFASGPVFTAPDVGREPEEINPKPASTVVRVVYNRVMNAILAHLAGQVGNSPKVVFNARESGEPPIYYLNGYVQNPIVQQMAMAAGMNDPRVQELDQIYGSVTVATNEQPNAGAGAGQDFGGAANSGDAGALGGMGEGDTATAGGDDSRGLAMAGGPLVQPARAASVAQPHPATAAAATEVGLSVPLQEPFVTQLKTMIDQGRVLTMRARMAGMPAPLGIIPPEALVEITDQTKAQFRQTVFDALWEQCGGDECTNENILNKKIVGWQPTLVESDRSKIDAGDSPITLTNVEGAQVFYDPRTSSYRRPQYAIMREPVGVEEGIAKYSDPIKYPGVAEAIRGKAKEGTLGSRLSRNGDGGRLSQIDFGSDMCVIRTLWYRDWAYPMDPDEALEKGKVQIVQVPDEQAIAAQQIAPPPAANTGTEGQVAEGSAEQIRQVEGGGANLPTNDATAAPQVQAIPTRSAFIDTDTGAEVTPLDPHWPIVYAIREIRGIEGEIVFDQRCRCPDIPLPCNINIPVPHSPYGIGEPDRLDGLQMAINRVLSDLVQRHRMKAYPPELMDSIVHDRLGPLLKRQRSQPNSMIVVPHEITQQAAGDLSKLVQFMELPEIAGDDWKLLEFLVEAIDREAGNTETTQGIAPSGTSGAWVANLQAAASQVMQVTSMSTEAWLKKIVRQILYFIDRVMTVEDCQKYTSKYPPPILAALHSQNKSPYIDISVEIQSGSAAAKQGQTQAMMMARQSGLSVSEPAVIERMNLDPDNELKRDADFMQKKIEAGLMPLPQTEQVGGEKKQPQAA